MIKGSQPKELLEKDSAIASVQNSHVTEVASLSIEHLCFGLGLCCWSYFSLGLGLSLCFVFHYHLF